MSYEAGPQGPQGPTGPPGPVGTPTDWATYNASANVVMAGNSTDYSALNGGGSILDTNGNTPGVGQVLTGSAGGNFVWSDNPPLYGLVSIPIAVPAQSTYYITLTGTAVTASSVVNTLLQIPDALNQTWIVNAFPAVSAGSVPYIQIDFSNPPITGDMVVAWSVVSYTSTTSVADTSAPA
jgi:hypothetical protein